MSITPQDELNGHLVASNLALRVSNAALREALQALVETIDHGYADDGFLQGVTNDARAALAPPPQPTPGYDPAQSEFYFSAAQAYLSQCQKLFAERVVLCAALRAAADRLGVLIEADNEDHGGASPDDVAAYEACRAALVEVRS